MKLLVTGSGGLLGSEFVRAAARRGWPVAAPPRAEMDITDAAGCLRTVEAEAPDCVIHCAGFTKVDQAEAEADEAMRVNRDGTANVAKAAARAGAVMVHISTDYVFDGARRSPYRPDDETAPLGAYARSKVAAEEAVRALAGERWLIVRTGWLYGEGRRDFVDLVLERHGADAPLRIVDDQWGRPTWTRNAVETVLDLVEAGTHGVVHVNDGGETTWHGLALAVLRESGATGAVGAISSEAFAAPARRPLYSVLDLSATEAELGREMTPWREALRSYLSERSRREPSA